LTFSDSPTLGNTGIRDIFTRTSTPATCAEAVLVPMELERGLSILDLSHFLRRTGVGFG
jgi:hypothetical protein